MSIYIEAIEARREIVRLYDTANKSKNAQDFTKFQSMGDAALDSWTGKYGLLDTTELKLQTLLLR